MNEKEKKLKEKEKKEEWSRGRKLAALGLFIIITIICFIWNHIATKTNLAPPY